MPLPSPPPLPLRLLIAATCLGSGLALAGGRQLLLAVVPPLDPTTPQAALQRARYGSSDPQRRRDAALLLSAEPGRGPGERLRLLAGQGWGRDPLAAVVLKQSALASEANAQPQRAERLWRLLLQRFPQQAATADALYALGRQQPQRRSELLRRFPAHPAALAAALEAGNALHLARWGPRWPGAEALLRQACRPGAGGLTPQQRQQLASGLAQLGDGGGALACLGSNPNLGRPLQLSLAQALLHGDTAQQRQGEQWLLLLSQRWPRSPEAQEAATLLAQQEGPQALALLSALPKPLQQSAAVQARLVLAQGRPWQPVLSRWPRDPASWDLQWDLARRALLQRQWPLASRILASLDSRLLPAPLAARQLFWQGYSARAQGQTQQAQRLWQRLLAELPGGYYAWRASIALGLEDRIDPRQSSVASWGRGPELAWHPLASGDPSLDALWRAGQPLEAWEAWRHRQGGRPPRTGTELQLEGRLRMAIGDDWTGLGQLELANLRLPQGQCRLQRQRDLEQHPLRYRQPLQRAAEAAGVLPQLLLAVAKQESRFSAGVQSNAGAVGLLQLMPSTAADLAGQPLTLSALQQPDRNLALGAQYLRQLLDQWQGNPVLAVASYNAGPGAVQAWITAAQPNPTQEPELWIEAIPYPETRLYAKKVLGNLWSYRQLEQPGC